MSQGLGSEEGQGSRVGSSLVDAGDPLPEGISAFENDDGLDERVSLAALELDFECFLASSTLSWRDLLLLGREKRRTVFAKHARRGFDEGREGLGEDGLSSVARRRLLVEVSDAENNVIAGKTRGGEGGDFAKEAGGCG